MVAVYYLSQMTRQHVTMVQSGDGADEIWLGTKPIRRPSARKISATARIHPQKVISPLVNSLPASDAKVSLDAKLKRFVAGRELSGEEVHGTWRMIFNADERQQLLNRFGMITDSHSDFLDLYQQYFERTDARDPLNRLLYVDTRFYLPNDMLVKVDRMSMAHGLEAREPSWIIVWWSLQLLCRPI